ncbi:MAG: cell division protein DedD [Psychromonas sp.]|nr:cell division protein DedD [Psychromonas sp.]
MNNQFKNRLVGVTIFVACVIIFLPGLINGKKKVYVDKFVAIPIRPEFKKHTLSLDAAKQNKVLEDNSQRAKSASSDSSKQASNDPSKLASNEVSTRASKQSSKQEIPVAKKKNKAVTDETWKIKEEVKTVATQSKQSKKNQGKLSRTSHGTKALHSQAWTIQLGAFKNAKNINTLLKRLNRAGFQVHTMPLHVIDGQITRVFVGPDVSKSKLEKAIPALKKLTNLNGHLIPFDAVNP